MKRADTLTIKVFYPNYNGEYNICKVFNYKNDNGWYNTGDFTKRRYNQLLGEVQELEWRGILKIIEIIG